MPNANIKHGITCWEKFSLEDWIIVLNQGNTVTKHTIQNIFGQFVVEGDISPLIAALITTGRLTSVVTINNFSIIFLSAKKISVFIAGLKTANHLASVVTGDNIRSILYDTTGERGQIEAFIAALKTAGHLAHVINDQNFLDILSGGLAIRISPKKFTYIVNALKDVDYLAPFLINTANFNTIFDSLSEIKFSILIDTLKTANHLKLVIDKNNFNSILNGCSLKNISALVDALEAANQLIDFITAENFKSVLYYLSAEKIPNLIAALKTTGLLSEFVNDVSIRSILHSLRKEKIISFTAALETANHLVTIATADNINFIIQHLSAKQNTTFITALEKSTILPKAERIEDFKKCVILRLKIIDTDCHEAHENKFTRIINQINYLTTASAIKEALLRYNQASGKQLAFLGAPPKSQSRITNLIEEIESRIKEAEIPENRAIAYGL